MARSLASAGVGEATHAQVDVAGHVHHVRGVGHRPAEEVCRGRGALRGRRGLDGVDVEVVQPRVVGIELQARLDRRDDLRRPLARLAVEGRVEVPRVEVHQRLGEQEAHLGILGIPSRQLPHRVRVSGLQGCLRLRGGGRRVAVALRHGGDEGALEPGGRRRPSCGELAGLSDRRRRHHRPLGQRRQVDVGAEREGDAPGAHRAGGVAGERLAEGGLGLLEVEGVHPAQPLVEVVLGIGAVGGDRTMGSAEAAVERHGARGRRFAADAGATAPLVLAGKRRAGGEQRPAGPCDDGNEDPALSHRSSPGLAAAVHLARARRDVASAAARRRAPATRHRASPSARALCSCSCGTGSPGPTAS